LVFPGKRLEGILVPELKNSSEELWAAIRGGSYAFQDLMGQRVLLGKSGCKVLRGRPEVGQKK
jgi:hypothetical protein